jgi:hydrogenase-1 operon protein HyaE
MTHPLLERLHAACARQVADAASWQALAELPGEVLLFCGGDPGRFPECLDVAVVLPELQRAFPGRCTLAVAAPALEARLQAHYGFGRWPSLVFLRQGAYLGAIEGMQDWSAYLARTAELLAARPSRPPSVGIPVLRADGAPSCS